MTATTGNLVVFSGPSGAGKTTVVSRLLDECDLPLRLCVSATTRPPRPGEEDGKAYHFLSQTEFDRRREAGEFLEVNEVFGRGYWYGTLREEVEAGIAQGQWVVLEIDVEGALQVLEHYPHALTFFIRTQSLAELEQRLRARGTENEETIAGRLAAARRELLRKDKYRYDIVNWNVDESVSAICRLLLEEASRLAAS